MREFSYQSDCNYLQILQPGRCVRKSIHFDVERAGVVEKTAQEHGESRIVIVSSIAHKAARKLDYDSLQKTVPGETLSALLSTFKLYMDSKLANVYFANELDRRLQERGVTNVYVNSCHPGKLASTTAYH